MTTGKEKSDFLSSERFDMTQAKPDHIKIRLDISPKKINPYVIGNFARDAYQIHSTHPPELMVGGTENAGWLIDAAGGRYVAKIFAGSSGKVGHIGAELQLYPYLQQIGVNVPKVINTIAGSSIGLLTLNEVEYPVVMMKLENLRRASALSITKVETELLARTVAKMHKELQFYPRKEHITQTTLPQSLLVQSRGFEDLISSPNSSIFNEKELSAAQDTEDKATQFVQTQTVRNSLSSSLLHGDLSLGHMQFLPDGNVYLFDFSDFSFGPIVWELATLLVYFYKEGHISIERWLELSHYFIEQYKKNMNMSLVDIEMLQFCLIDRLLFEIHTLNGISRVEPTLVDSEGNKNRYQLASFLLDNPYC